MTAWQNWTGQQDEKHPNKLCLKTCLKMQSLMNAHQSGTWKSQASAEYLAKDVQPFTTVTGPGFIKMIKSLDKRYNIPARTSVRLPVGDNFYSKCKQTSCWKWKWLGFLLLRQTCEQVVHLSCIKDRALHQWRFWTQSSLPSDRLFPRRSHRRKHRCGSERGPGLLECIPEEMPVCITTDNPSNMIKRAELNECNRLQCFGHRLHLSIGKSTRCLFMYIVSF